MYDFYYPIYMGTIRGKRREWNVTISEGFDTAQDPEPVVNGLRFRKRLKFQWSNPSGGKLSRGVMPSYVRLEVLDTNRRVYNRFQAARKAGYTDKKFRVYVTAQGGFTWMGYVQLTELETLVAYRKRIPVLQFQVNDGISTIEKNRVGDYEGKSLHAAFRNLLAYQCQPLPILYKLRWQPSNIEPGVAITPRVVLWDAVKLIPELDKRLESLAQTFFVRVWQDLKGRWRVEQVPIIGREMGELNGCEFATYQGYNPARDELTEVQTVGCTSSRIDLTHTSPGLDGAFTESGEDPVGEVVVKLEADYKKDDTTFNYINFVRDGYFDCWYSETNPMLWQTTGTVRRDNRGQIAERPYCASLEGFSSITHPLKFVDANEDFYFYFSFNACVENAGATPDNCNFLAFIVPEDPAEQTYYLDAGGEWVTGYTSISSQNLTAYATGAAGPLTFDGVFIRSIQKPPVTGQLHIKIEGSAGKNLLVDSVYVMPVDREGNYEGSVSWQATFKNRYGGQVVGGESVSVERKWFNWVAFTFGQTSEQYKYFGVYRSDGGLYDGVTPAIVPIDGWKKIGGTTVYYDLGQMAANEGYFKFTPWGPTRFRGTLQGLIDPGYAITVNGIPCVCMNLTVDAITETSEGEWVENAQWGGSLGDPLTATTLITI